MRSNSVRTRRALLAACLERIVDRDFPEASLGVRNPAALRRWATAFAVALRRWTTAFAAATSTTTASERIRDPATPGQGSKPARSTTIPYRDTLEHIWVSDPVLAWTPARTHLNRLTGTPEHYVADPSLAGAASGSRSSSPRLSRTRTSVTCGG